MLFIYNDVGVKRYLPPMIPDCFALRAPTILKTFIIRSFFYEKWLLIHVLAGPKVKNPLASKLASDFRPFDPGIIIYNMYIKCGKC
jgi:hypothetical protein